MGNDVILGDNGKIDYEILNGEAVVREITNIGDIYGAGDLIYTGLGKDIVLGGVGSDTINAGDASSSIIVGDNGEVVYDNSDDVNHYLDHVTAAETDIGDGDIITTGSADDIILGGMGDDQIITGLGNDIALGDNGTVQYTKGILDFIKTTDDAFGGNDTILGSGGDKIYFGGFGHDKIKSRYGDDLVFGDGGIIDYENGILVEANGFGVRFGGDDVIDTGIGLNTVIGGLGDDIITTGIDRETDRADFRENYSNDMDVVIGDNGRRTFNKTGLQANDDQTATMSFNFQGKSSKGIEENQTAGAPESKVSNWINVKSDGPTTYGNDPNEQIRLDNGQYVEGLNLSIGGKEKHRTDSIELHNYLMENYNPDDIRDPQTGELLPGDGYLYNGGVRTSAPNDQIDNKLEVEMDGLSKYFKRYSVVVYIDAPESVSTLRQNWPNESIRKVNIDSADKRDSFFIDDAADANDAAFNTFDGEYIRATARDAASARGQYANYVVFEGLTDDRFVVTITDGVPNMYYNGLDLPSIAGIQIVGEFHPIDKIESSVTEAGGDDTITTSGGDDIVIGGAGSDSIATFGDIRDGIDDADTVIGDNGMATVMYRKGWHVQSESGEWIPSVTQAEIVNAQTYRFQHLFDSTDVTFDDIIFTGNGNDVVIGGEGQDRINTQRHDDIAADIWTSQDRTAPEVMRPETLEMLQNFETESVKVLSLNFSYSYNDSNKSDSDLKVDESQYAGVVAAKNWNNVELQDQLDPVQYPNPYLNTSFKMDDGTEAAGLDLNIRARELPGGNLTSLQVDRSNGHDQIQADSENSRLFEGYYWGQKQQQIEININNVGDQTGFDVYDVYVYIDGDDERTDSDNFIYQIMGGDIASGDMSTRYLNDWKGNTFNGEFREVIATSYEEVNNGVVPNMDMVGNYVVFRNVTAKDFAIRMKNVQVGDQSPLNMPSISGVQIVAGSGRNTVAASQSSAGYVPRNGDFDKDVVLGDNGEVNYTLDIPYGTNDRVEIAQNKAFEVVADPSMNNGIELSSQSDYIVTGRNQDLIIGGNGNDAIDSGEGHDVVIGDNAGVKMVDYNPLGVREPMNLKILDHDVQDNNPYVGKEGSTEDQFRAKIESGNVEGIELIESEFEGNDIVDGGYDNDLIYGQGGSDALIGNEGDDVIYDTAGTNRIKNSAYADASEYENDMADVLPHLDGNGILVLREFIANDYGQTSMVGVITEGMDIEPGSDSASYDLSNGEDVVISMEAGEEIVLTSSNWAGKDNQYWNPDIVLEFNGEGGVIPNLQLSWDVNGSTQTASVPSGTWYHVVNQIPDQPNDNGLYNIRLTSSVGGTFRVKMTNY